MARLKAAALVFVLCASLLPPFPVAVEFIGRAPHHCHRNYRGALVSASSSWYGWEARHAIRGATWSSSQVSLKERRRSSCALSLTDDCPQFIRVDFAKPTRLRVIRFRAYNQKSTPTRLAILGAEFNRRRRGDAGVAEPEKDAWTPLRSVERGVNPGMDRQISYSIPRKEYASIMIEIKEIVASTMGKDFYYATITNLLMC